VPQAWNNALTLDETMPTKTTSLEGYRGGEWLLFTSVEMCSVSHIFFYAVQMLIMSSIPLTNTQ